LGTDIDNKIPGTTKMDNKWDNYRVISRDNILSVLYRAIIF
jgi:hypothetical protein